jgi:hypothetical protein
MEGSRKKTEEGTGGAGHRKRSKRRSVDPYVKISQWRKGRTMDLDEADGRFG